MQCPHFCLQCSPGHQSLGMEKSLLQLLHSLAPKEEWVSCLCHHYLCHYLIGSKGFLVSSVPLIWCQFTPMKSPHTLSCSFLPRWGIWYGSWLLRLLHPWEAHRCHLLGTGDTYPTHVLSRIILSQKLAGFKTEQTWAFGKIVSYYILGFQTWSHYVWIMLVTLQMRKLNNCSSASSGFSYNTPTASDFIED